MSGKSFSPLAKQQIVNYARLSETGKGEPTLKTCHYCHNEIPEDTVICPFCGSDLTLVETASDSPAGTTGKQDPSFTKQRRSAQKTLTLQHALQGMGSYLAYNGKRLRHPLYIDSRTERSLFFGYINIAISALLSGGIVARLGFAFQTAYDFLRDISILPFLNFQMNAWEWFWKAAIFFFSYYLLYPVLAFFFRKAILVHPIRFHTGVTRFAGMNALLYMLLWVAFLLSLVAPLALAIPLIIIVLLHVVGYTAAFVIYLHQPPLEGREEKVLYHTYLGIGIHVVLVVIIGYLLFKV